MKFDIKGFSNEELINFCKAILKPRLIEEKMLILLRQGKISKWFSAFGQEAVSVGATLALNQDEYILPMHRNLGIFTSRNIPLNRLFAQFQGKESGFTQGRDRSFHFGSKEHNIVGMISHLGSQLGVADGIALANKLKQNNKVTLVVSGDASTSEGDFHESLNVASVWELPVIFMIENNQWGLSTPSSEQFRNKYFIDKAIGYGIKGVQIDGNNIIDVYKTMKEVAEEVRKSSLPIIVEMMTFRMRGHEEASGTKYYPDGIQDEWSKKDPIVNYENFMIKEKILTKKQIEQIRFEIKNEIQNALNDANNEPSIKFDKEKELSDLYAPFVKKEKQPSIQKKSLRFIDAISDGLRQAMIKYNNLILMGQDIAKYGGVFKITENFVQEFGKDRVRNTPLCESAILGTSLGLSINGYKAMVEMQFADFVSEGMTQICNNIAKIHWRWKQNADVVIRMPTGAGVRAGPFHSQSNEAWFTHISGLKIVYPAFPADAKGLLIQAFEDPNPVLFFEHKALYRSIREEVSQGYYNIPFGKANLLKKGTDITIITYGMGVHWALDTLQNNQNIKADLIDLRTLVPLDIETICNSVKKTGRVIILHEDSMFGGIGGEISAIIQEQCFEYLDAPITRVASLDTPVPFAANLEKEFLPNERFTQKLKELLEY